MRCLGILVRSKRGSKSRGKMKKGLTVAILVGLLQMGFSNPAIAKDKTLSIPNVASITYPAVVKLVNSGCQTIRFKYEAKGVSKRFGFMSLILQDADGSDVGGAFFVRGPVLLEKYPIARPLKTKGFFPLKICRENWIDESLNNVEISEAWPSTMEIEFSAEPKRDVDITPRVIGTIKFTGKFVGDVLDDLFP